MPVLTKVQQLPISITNAWDFFSNPRNLARITPPQLGFELLTDVGVGIYNGMVLEYRVRPVMNIPLRWVSEIKHIEPLRRFVDEQRVGPYQFWYHLHLFREIPGGVEVTDQVHYTVTTGPVGRAVDTLLVRRKLEEIFTFREKTLEKIFSQ